ncbi:acyltransferase ChoActase/COT/CPT [Macrolepiota fuliginosa MF-IS2]|uniref:Acyltransferase ChoActase/COT/CPT n=1 Tax=Macrolepiota fuliginosa MF-IS2 TaxID=1400762 RepID=A0A9P6C7H1_9AGAR|nr:acyltransferase ChoActase/COT/CPT [Macrolepiota fuliginosa MF-IS2]
MRPRSLSTAAKPLSLPRLPVPDLRKSLDKYLSSIEPFLHEAEQSSQAFSDAYQLRRKWADEFYFGIGSVLQERLIALDKASPNNWLDDNFWINKAYHEWRAPLLINSNWWLAFYDDDLIPETARMSVQTEDGMAGTTTWQLRRAAWLVHRTLEFKDRLATQELHPETTRTGIWLRESTSKMFNVARIPQPHCDTLSQPPPKPHSLHARSLLVMFHNFCYTIPIYSPSGELALPRDIYRRLRSIIADVDGRLKSGEKAFPIGVLSADNRDTWAKNLNHLLSLSQTNKTSHQSLLTSVMALSLDHTPYTLPSQEGHPRTQTQSTLDAHLHSTRTTSQNLSNRFFDKPYTILVDPLARAGATGEHSPCDALVPSIVAEYGIVSGVEEDAFPSTEGESTRIVGGEDGFIRLDWVADDQLWRETKEAECRSVALIEDSDDSVFWFDGYGTDWMKTVAKLSPDAYIQMALQLAWYRTRGTFTATYETVLTRMFKRGRTETIRTFTNDSRAWVLSMVNPSTSLQTQHTLLTKAILTHSKLTRDGATGRGFDRHLLGLQLLHNPTSDGPSPPLFADPLFSQSQEWKLSTSGLSAGHWFKGTGFGAAYNDGYGINYLAAPEMIKFGIESKHSSPLTSTYAFKNAVDAALKDMKGVCLAGIISPEPDSVRSHL